MRRAASCRNASSGSDPAAGSGHFLIAPNAVVASIVGMNSDK
jgi:hypothetical protein